MSPEKFQQLMQLFQRAIELPEDQRLAFIDRACEGDMELVAELRALIGASPAVNAAGGRGGSHANPVVTGAGLAAFAAGSDFRPSGALPPRQPITPVSTLSGNYRLMRVIGEGGMGIVYEAEQAFPRRRVAIKALKPGIGGASILRRFQNEAQVLARLQHPGIAQVYEAGAAEDADSASASDDAFFVMEFVDGLPLNTYCETNALPTSQRLDLMLKVCDAVQHAHQRGVIHRDLKPANILVASTDHGPQPKVLDFGVARLQDVREQYTTVHTHVGQIIGTLAYMSPEQLVGSGGGADSADIDIRADVYALGVILYQLLTGRLPLELANRPLPEVARIVRDETPTRLSVINRTLRGDLEVIVSKSLEKDRERRYSSAAALAEDIRRFLSGQPILARRDSTAYVLSKLVRRHKLPVALATISLCGIVAFGVIAAYQARANRLLAANLADELHQSRIERGRLTAATGNTALSEDMLWQQWVRRPGDSTTKWALRELYARTPLFAAGPMMDGVPNRIAYSGAVNAVVVSKVNGAIDLLTPALDRTIASIDTKLSGTLAASAVSPDGRAIVIGSAGGTLACWDLAAQQQVFRVDGPKLLYQIIAFAPDGRSFFLAGSTGDVTVHDARSGSPLLIAANVSSPTAVLGVDHQVAVVGTRLGQLHVIDIVRQRVERVLSCAPGAIANLALSSDGGTLLVISDSGSLSVIDTRSWMLTRRIEVGDGFRALALADEDQKLFVSGSAGIRIIDPRSMSRLATLTNEDAGAIAIAPAGRGIYTLGFGPSPRWLPAHQNPLAIEWTSAAEAGQDWILAAALSPDARRYATGTSRGVLSIWDLATRTIVAQHRGKGAVRTIAFDPATERLYVGGQSNDIEVFDASTLKPLSAFRAHDTYTFDLAVLSGGDIISVGADSHIRRFSSDGTLVRERLVQEKPNTTGAIRLGISPDQRIVAISGSSPSLWVGSTADFSTIYEKRAPFGFMRTRFSPDGTLMATSGNFHSIEVRDTRTFEVLRTFRGHEGPVVEVIFDASSSILFSGGIDSTIRVWDPRAGHNLATFSSPTRETSTIRPLPDGRSIITAGSDGIVRTWDFALLDAAIARTMPYQLGRIPLRNPVPDADIPGVRAWSAAALQASPALIPGPDNPQNDPDPH
ncbi:MAG: protein kinase [Phycisphaerales bacterium]|nr:protein kinase [Phycisphaerales bacterium]